MLWSVPVVPTLAGVGLWVAGSRVRHQRRAVLGAGATVALVATIALAGWAAADAPTATLDWGAGLVLRLGVHPLAAIVAVTVPVIALPVVLYAAAHEPVASLDRLVGLMVAFVGAMLLLVLAADLVTLLIGWELVGAASWALIGHAWRDVRNPQAGAHAFNATRLGDLGLFAAAGAALVGVGGFAYEQLHLLSGWPLQVLVAGVLLAAITKSAQIPAAPWLFSAMAGPTPVSALLHAATVVAAGAYVLARLHHVLAGVSWFGPTTLAIGLVTAVAGGVVAALQSHVKKLLAASTSAHHGLMLVAIGAGYPAVAVVHLVAHAAFKALLFLAAGDAIAATGSAQLERLRLGRQLRWSAGTAAVGSLALAAVPPLGAAWSKEGVVAAAGHHAVWAAVVTVIAGGLSAFYAARFQLLTFGSPPHGDAAPRTLLHRPGRAERTALGVLAALSLALGAVWLPEARRVVVQVTAGQLPTGASWELAASLAVVVLAFYAAVVLARHDRLGALSRGARTRAVADWLALPALTRRAVVDPTLALSRALARWDDRVVDAGVRGAGRLGALTSRLASTLGEASVDGAVEAVAALARRSATTAATVVERGVDGTVRALAVTVGAAGRDARRLQTGSVHHYYIIIATTVLLGLGVAALWR